MPSVGLDARHSPDRPRLQRRFSFGRLVRAAGRKHLLGKLHKSRSAPSLRDIGRFRFHPAREVPHICDTAGMGKVRKHRGVIRAVATIKDPVAGSIYVETQLFGGKPTRHAQLVPVPEPPVDMDRRDLGRGALLLEDRLDALNIRGRQRPDILGEIYGEIQDLQGRFNINNLVDANGEVDQPSLEQFQRLLLSLGLDPRIAGITADWLDADQDAGFPDGAEDPIYTGFTPPYRAPNQIVPSTSELAAIEGMDKEILDVLLPHVTALPGRTAINVNTATGPVLQSLDPDMTVADVEGLLSQRGETGFADINNAFSAVVKPDVLSQLAETSDYFRLKVIVRVDTVRVTFYSLMERSAQGDVTPILRSLGTI